MDDDDALLDKAYFGDDDNIFCADALVISSTATPVPDADMYVWSLGVTLVELLLGDRQWSKGPVRSLVYEEQLRICCKPLPEILWSILRGCLQTDRSKRMRVDELIDLIERNHLDT